MPKISNLVKKYKVLQFQSKLKHKYYCLKLLKYLKIQDFYWKFPLPQIFGKIGRLLAATQHAIFIWSYIFLLSESI